jgi:hypothetical protein
MSLTFLTNEELYRTAIAASELTPEMAHELLVRFEQLLDEADAWDDKEIRNGDDA